jgi:hypothetical protein
LELIPKNNQFQVQSSFQSYTFQVQSPKAKLCHGNELPERLSVKKLPERLSVKKKNRALVSEKTRGAGALTRAIR